MRSRGFPSPGSQAGLALAGSLVLLIVLALLGTGVYWSTRSDVVHAGRDARRMRADFAAESAVQWALLEVSRYDGGRVPYAKGTHDASGATPIPKQVGGARNPAFLDPDSLALYPGRTVRLDGDGWIVSAASQADKTFSGGKNETLAFKVWYPDARTLRISGRGEVEGVTARMDIISRLDSTLVPL